MMGDFPPYLIVSAIMAILIGSGAGGVIFAGGVKKNLGVIDPDVCLNTLFGSIGFFILGFALWLPVLCMSPFFGLFLYFRHLLLKRKAP